MNKGTGVMNAKMIENRDGAARHVLLKDYLTMTLAILLSAIGVYFFKFPNQTLDFIGLIFLY